MCFGGSSNSNTSTTQTNSTLDPIDRQTKNIALNRAMQIMNQSFPGYDWSSRVSPFSSAENKGLNRLTAMADGNPNPNYGYAVNQAKAYGAAPAGTVNTSRVVDEGGRLGKISDYVNPYINNALAPALREIRDSGTKQRNEIGSSATMSGAFGDARHGIVEAEQMRGENQTIGDVTGQAYAQAYNTAMGQRAGDLDRFVGADSANAALREQMLQRQLQSGQSAMEYDLANNQSQLAILKALMEGGAQQRNVDQAGRNAKYEEFLRGVEWPFRGLDAILSVLSGTPSSSQQVSTTVGPEQQNNWLAQLLGSIGGAVLR